jgi:hypothetical protein
LQKSKEHGIPISPPPITEENFRQIYVDSQQGLIYETIDFNYKQSAFTRQTREETPPLASLGIFTDAVVDTDAGKATFRDLRHAQTEFQTADLDQMSDGEWCVKCTKLLQLSEAVGKLFDEDRAAQGFQQPSSQFGLREYFRNQPGASRNFGNMQEHPASSAHCGPNFTPASRQQMEHTARPFGSSPNLINATYQEQKEDTGFPRSR